MLDFSTRCNQDRRLGRASPEIGPGDQMQSTRELGLPSCCTHGIIRDDASILSLGFSAAGFVGMYR